MNRKSFLKKVGTGAVGLTTFQSIPFQRAKALQSPPWSSQNYAWVSNHKGTDDELRVRLELMKNAGLDGILPSSQYEKWVQLAEEFELDVHAWFITLQRSSDEPLIRKHPDWFMVNRNGESSVTFPAYVDYYKWLCPTRPEAQEYILNKVDEILKISEIKSVHLDYIRYPDVILPIQLQPGYGVVQDKEYPQYDYCFCDACRRKYQTLYGDDPILLDNPTKDDTFSQFRYNQVTHLVNQVAMRVHNQGVKLTAAVFPTPEIARSLVRQNWPDWNLDAVFPMQYNHFYHKPVRWIGQAVAEGRRELPATTEMFSGLYVPEMTPIEVSQAYEFGMENGANGICLFSDHSMTEEHWAYLSRVMQKG